MDTHQPERDKAMKLSTVSRCVEVRSCTMAALPVYLMDENSKERIEAPSGEGAVGAAQRGHDPVRL